MPSLYIYTPLGWLNALNASARSQYRRFEPTPEDTLRALVVISHGCASGTPAGPVCESITRVVLLSDLHGGTVVEAISNKALGESWQNGFGARAACSALVSRFSMADVETVRNAKGEFLVATFDGAELLKTYTIKEKHLKKLGM
jgi:hypothetical protein